MQWGHQHIVLERALEHLKPAHVLVPHCRRRLADEGDDMLQLLYQLKASVPREQKIHLHYFSGSTLAVEKWCQAYPNAQFGYTTMGLGQAAKEALQTLEPGRLLLETDLPYFKPPAAEFGTPGHLGSIAAAVGRIRDEPWQDVLQLASNNARRLYEGQ